MQLRTLVSTGALVLAVASLLTGCGSGAASPGAVVQQTPSPFLGGGIDQPFIEPDFTLHDQRGQTYSLTQFRGRVVLVTFIYAHCPDVCPLIASNLNQALRQLASDRDKARVLAVSVDPEGDTPRAVDAYRKEHRLLPEFVYLIGSRAELLPVWKAYHVDAVARSPDLVDHTAYTVLIDQSGKARALYDSRIQARDVVHDVRVLLKWAS